MSVYVFVLSTSVNPIGVSQTLNLILYCPCVSFSTYVCVCVTAEWVVVAMVVGVWFV